MNTYPPTGRQLKAYLRDFDLTTREAGALLRLKDPSARIVRLWTSGQRIMPFPSWFTLRTLVDGEPPEVDCAPQRALKNE